MSKFLIKPYRCKVDGKSARKWRIMIRRGHIWEQWELGGVEMNDFRNAATAFAFLPEAMDDDSWQHFGISA